VIGSIGLVAVIRPLTRTPVARDTKDASYCTMNVMFAAARSVSRTRATAGACGAGSGAARALGGVPVAHAPASPPPHWLRQLGAVWERRDAVAGSPRFGRVLACLGGGGGGGVWGALAASRAMSSSSGDGGGGSSSVNDKLRVSREKRVTTRGEGVGERTAGGAARGGRRGSGASARGGGGGGGRGRWPRVAGGGVGVANGKASELVQSLNVRILRAKDQEGLLRLVAGADTRPLFS
jgi:hypothetical protein